MGDVWILFAQSPQLQTNLKEGGQLNIFSNFELSVTGVNKKPFAFPFQDRQFQNPDPDYRQFQKFLLVTDSFGPKRCGKICAEVLLHVTNYDGEVINHSHTHTPESPLYLKRNAS